MTNEEFQKIVLEELRSLNGKVDKLEQGQTKLEQGQTKLEQGQAKLEQGQAKLEQSQEEIKRDIKAISNQTADLTEFRQETKNEFKDIKATISRIEIATADNWSDIAKLKSVK